MAQYRVAHRTSGKIIHFEVKKKREREYGARLGGSIDVITGCGWVTLGQDFGINIFMYVYVNAGILVFSGALKNRTNLNYI